jgi:hypothetical protein
MGYSYYFVAKDTEFKERMLRFLQQRMPTFADIHPCLELNLKSGWVDWMYCRNQEKKLAIGYEIVSSVDVHYFQQEVLKWAARHAGRKIHYSKIEHEPEAPTLQPYIVYDARENLSAKPIPNLLKFWSQSSQKGKPYAEYYANKTSLWEFDLTPQELQDLTDETLSNLEKDWQATMLKQMLPKA